MKRFRYWALGLLKFRQSQFTEAKQLMEKGLTKIAIDPDEKTEIRLLVGLARVGFAQGKLVEGIEGVKKAAKLADEGKIVREQIEVNTLLNTLYLTIGQNEDALKAALYAVKISDESGNKAFRSLAVNALGRSYHFQGDYPQAIKFFEESIKLAEETNQARAAATGYHTLATVYFDLSDFVRAEKNTRKAIKSLEKDGGTLEKSLANLLLAQIYLQQNKFAEIKPQATELLELAKKLKNGLLRSAISTNIRCYCPQRKELS
ncbi:MAG: tetratricopeptide repeat protein [Blastocatellia bacterium]|nr:tetratricopeptide repeat protein [Blastocatellia bacterium]